MENQNIDILWVLLGSVLVFIMQGGFLCLEAGLTRSKNTINVAMKNMLDLLLSVIMYWLFAFGLMFGATYGGLLGTSFFMPDIGPSTTWLAVFFVFQTMFCATSATIVSGAVAERMSYSGYVLLVVLIVGFLYPVFGHWAWGGAYTGQPGWLQAKGFVDFAGSTVVHSVGGWVALAAIWIIGPRHGRFDEKGGVRPIHAYNLPLAMLGVLLLFVGWFGFNGGSTLSMNHQVPGIIANTMLAGAAGGLIVILPQLLTVKRVAPNLIMNGTIAGLVGITACCHVVHTPNALMIGAVAGLLMRGTQSLMLRAHLDDAIGAVPSHLAAGIWGTLSVGIFGDLSLIGNDLSRIDQIVVQLEGISVCAFWSFGLGYLILKFINRWLMPLRVTPDAEDMGLNVSEHGASTELVDLLRQMSLQEQSADLTLRVHEEPFTEVGQIAHYYNRVMGSLERAADFTRNILRDLNDALLVFVDPGWVVNMNPSAVELFDFPRKDMGNHRISELFATPDHEPINDLWFIEHARNHGSMEIVAKRSNGEWRQVEITLGYMRMLTKEYFTAVIRDITEQINTQNRLFAEKELAHTTLESIGDGVIRADADGKITYINPVAAALTEYSSREACGMRLSSILRLSPENEPAQGIDPISQLNEHQCSSFQSVGFHKITGRNGRKAMVIYTSSFLHDTESHVVGFVLVFRDITDHQKMVHKLSYQATHDPLTGLSNRRAFEHHLRQLIDQGIDRPGLSHALVMLDLDDFKIVNDTAGHQAGDDLLRGFATIIRRHTRNSDVVARMGGDEFAIILRNCSLDKAKNIMNQCLKSMLEYRFQWEGRIFQVGASIGLTLIDHRTTDFEGVIGCADRACYASKEAGGASVMVIENIEEQVFPGADQNDEVQRWLCSLEQIQVQFIFHPIIARDDESSPARDRLFEVYAFCSLAGHEERIALTDIMTMLERHKVMPRIESIVLSALFKEMEKIRSALPDIVNWRFGFNLSRASLFDEQTPGLFKPLLERYAVLTRHLYFEIPERALMMDIGYSRIFLDSLAQQGCMICLDHFGSSVGSFTHLHSLPFSMIKIDASFVRGAASDPNQQRIVHAIAQLGQSLHMRTIAEGVDNAAIYQKLVTLKIDYLQGNYFGKAMGSDQIIDYLLGKA